jgi:hypothetical protein
LEAHHAGRCGDVAAFHSVGPAVSRAKAMGAAGPLPAPLDAIACAAKFSG